MSTKEAEDSRELNAQLFIREKFSKSQSVTKTLKKLDKLPDIVSEIQFYRDKLNPLRSDLENLNYKVKSCKEGE